MGIYECERFRLKKIKGLPTFKYIDNEHSQWYRFVNKDSNNHKKHNKHQNKSKDKSIEQQGVQKKKSENNNESMKEEMEDSDYDVGL